MNGTKATFKLGEGSFELSRANWDEMPEMCDRISNGETKSILLEAASENRDAFEAAFEAADRGNAGELWNEYLAFLGYEAYYEKFWAPQEARMARVDAIVRERLEARGLLQNEPSEGAATN